MFGKEARKTAEYGYIGVPSADPNEDRQTIAENFAVLVKAWEGGRLPIGELPEGSGMIACFGGSWLSCRDRMTENHAAVGPLSSGRGINPITIW
ncbi:MAG: hypothetical protein LBD95_07945, partial [Clostridiales Family XIII bacterium]|nr:hypothetical protein [Clostridiales Family XIII bacterium]